MLKAAAGSSGLRSTTNVRTNSSSAIGDDEAERRVERHGRRSDRDDAHRVREVAPGDRRAAAGFRRRAANRTAPNAIIRPITSFGSMPAPGDASVPNGRSLLTRQHERAGDDECAAGDMVPAQDHATALERATSAAGALPQTLPIGRTASSTRLASASQNLANSGWSR